MEKICLYLKNFFNYIFKTEMNLERRKTESLVYFSILYLLGTFFWIFFFEISGSFYTAGDWPEAFRWIGIWKSAFEARQFPFHTAPVLPYTETSRVLSELNIPLTPQNIFTVLMSPKTYVLFNTLLLFSLGFLGSIKLAVSKGFSPFSFSVFFLLFNFNGHIISHVAIGHFVWLGYFLLPFFLHYVLQIAEKNETTKAPYWAAIVLFGILLQGSIHIFNFCLIFLGLMVLFSKGNFWPILKTIFIAISLSAIRIGPAILIYAERVWYGGYDSFAQLVRSMIFIYDEQFIPGVLYQHEYSLYIGGIGLIFLLVFGVFPLVYDYFKREAVGQAVLFLPIFLMLVLSFENIFQDLVRYIPVRYLAAERVTMRFVIIPFLFLVVIACIRLDKYIKSPKVDYENGIQLGALAILGSGFLMFHGKTWRLNNVEIRSGRDTVFIIQNIVSQPDPTYFLNLGISATVSLLVFLFVVKKLISNK